jgi:NhaP-type Na+/H+ and K+/H+ antiporter
VLILYLVAGILGVIAIFVTQASVLEGYIVGAVVAIAGAYLLYRLLQVPPLPSGRSAPPDAPPDASPPKQ